MNDDYIYNLLMQKDQEGLSLLMNKYGGLIAYVAKNTTNLCEEDLSECMSDILFTIWRRISKYDKKRSSFKSWVVMVSRGCSIDYLRKVSKHNTTVSIDEIASTLIYDKEMGGLSIEKIIELMQMLPPPDNEIFYARFVLGEDINFIASKLKVSKDSLYKRLKRGREKLKAIIQKEGY